MKEVKKVPFLQPLCDELGIQSEFSKAVLASLVFGTYTSNACGIDGDNMSRVEEVLTEGICGQYLWDILKLAGSWDNDLLDILAKHEPSINTQSFYREHVWPFMRTHEIVPGVIMHN